MQVNMVVAEVIICQNEWCHKVDNSSRWEWRRRILCVVCQCSRQKQQTSGWTFQKHRMHQTADEWTAHSAVSVDKESSRVGWQTGDVGGSSALRTTFAHSKKGISDVIGGCAHATSNNWGLMECSIWECSVPALSCKEVFFFFLLFVFSCSPSCYVTKWLLFFCLSSSRLFS